MAAQGMGMMGLAFCSFKKHELVWKQSAVQEQARKPIKSNSTFILPVCLVVTIMMAQTKKRRKRTGLLYCYTVRESNPGLARGRGVFYH